LFLHITCVSILEFTHLRPSHLEILITYSLSGAIDSMLRQDSVVTRLRCYFSPLDWELRLRNQPFAHVLRALGQIPSTAHIEKT
jgi:hypothetical protein